MSPKAVWVFQHIVPETPGILLEILADRGIVVRTFRFFEGEKLPENLEPAAGLIVMGGPMGVGDRDQYPFLTDELRIIKSAIQQETPVLGICLGAQLMAAALGAKVTQGMRKEIGWFPVQMEKAAVQDPLFSGAPASFQVLHWHGDRFDLPEGAVWLASSEVTPHQAFRYGSNAYGLQFHMEVTRLIVKGMVETFKDELKQEKLDGQKILLESQIHLPHLSQVGSAVFKKWADSIPIGASS